MDNSIVMRWLVVALVFTSLSISACGAKSPIRNTQLEEAKRQYDEASRNPDIVRRATPQLDSARDALEMAEARGLKNAKSHIAHYVYLFEQHMRMAELAVEQRGIQEKLKDRAEKAQQAALNDTVVRAEDAGLGENNWNLLLAAANATDASNTTESPSKVVDSDRGKVMTLGDVLFKVNQTTLAAGNEDMIENLVEFLNVNSDRMAVIEGHTDNTGDADYNRSLSRNRAFAVQEALIKAGIAGHRLAVRGVGESDPVASNDSESGRRLNRRVDVVLLD